MKLSPNIYSAQRTGFTLPEILIAMTIFIFLIGAVVVTQLFAVRIYYLAATKLTATGDGRRTVSSIREQVREAKEIYIGSYSNSSGNSGTFTQVGLDTNQIGSALLLIPTTNEAYGTIFYLDTSASNLCSVLITNIPYNANGLVSTNTITGSVSSLYTNAPFVTNYNVFQAEDYQGNVLANNQKNRVIHVTLQFYQLEYPKTGIGTNQMYDYYQLQTRATRRTVGE
jgi:prepilin-type N-terminal cleavage/methylation domain-containing protein